MNIESTLAERGRRYGDFTDHARICQNMKNVMGGTDGWDRLNAVQRQALEVIADKIARILNGDPNYGDNWHDIIGYAKLVEDRLPKTGTVTETALTLDPAQICSIEQFGRSIFERHGSKA